MKMLKSLSFVFLYSLIPAFVIGYDYRELGITDEPFLRSPLPSISTPGRDLRRMESKSPIFSDFGELLEGIVTVGAFSTERRFLNNLHGKRVLLRFA